ncbi:MAG: glycosyltransferase family 2 protein [Bryobacteraceae bacterium]
MSAPSRITVAIPTLAADDTFMACLRALQAQTLAAFDVVVIDNGGADRVRSSGLLQGLSANLNIRVISNPHNAGFGAAINQAFRASASPYLAPLNDDAVAHPGWLQALVDFADAHPQVGMLASQVRLEGTGKLDSAGMLLAADGSSKQRGHGRPTAEFERPSDAMFPSGSAALLRRAMLDEIGLFDESFFLYCEDTDLGLRARWAGWECQYVPQAVVEHRYSHSAGRASPLKAFYVERNRLYTVLKTFPMRMIWKVPFAAIARYGWHVVEMINGRGKGAEFRQAGHSAALLPWLVMRAHFAALGQLPQLLRDRRRIFASRRISAGKFAALASRHSISLREVATL